MKKMQKFIQATLIGGMLVILPLALFLFLLQWTVGFVTKLIQPLTQFFHSQYGMPQILADVLVVLILLAVCFFVGAFVRTRIGKWTYVYIEQRIFHRLPGYSMIKETTTQIFGSKKSLFSSVALARIYANDTLVTSFVTDEHPDGSYSVFVPTGPNPTSGNIYHLKREYVHLIDIAVEDAMRSIIGCGSGSAKLIEAFQKSGAQPPTSP